MGELARQYHYLHTIWLKGVLWTNSFSGFFINEVLRFKIFGARGGLDWF